MEYDNSNIKKSKNKLKCILIGDEKIGKSSIVQCFRTNEFSTVYVPTIWNNFTVRKHGPGRGDTICLDICDAGGQIEFDRLRPLCYTGVEVFIICFSVIIPSSFENIITKWIPEIKRHSPKNLLDSSSRVILLVGTQSDLRSNTNILLKLSEKGMSPVSEYQAMKLAKKIGAKSYIECSSLLQKNVKEIFDYTLTWGLKNRTSTIPQLINNDNDNNMDHVGGGFKIRGTSSGHFFRWKLYNQKRKKYSPSNKLKRFILMCCVF